MQLRRLRRSPPPKRLFSRYDKSAADVLEHRLWREADIDPRKVGSGLWYRDIGAGMGAALTTAQAMSAYTISDRRTWLSDIWA